MSIIHSGKGADHQGFGRIVGVNSSFGGTTPSGSDLHQDKAHGLNNLEKAKATQKFYSFLYNKVITRTIMRDFEKAV